MWRVETFFMAEPQENLSPGDGIRRDDL